MKIAIGSDHNGFELKQYILQNFDKQVKWIDVGSNNNEITDYPLYTLPVCLEVLQGSADYGILISDTGVGMCIAANRFSQIYAGIAWNTDIAQKIKENDNINILILPANFITHQDSLKIISAWLEAGFNKGRNKTRLDMIDSITDDNPVPPLKISCC